MYPTNAFRATALAALMLFIAIPEHANAQRATTDTLIKKCSADFRDTLGELV